MASLEPIHGEISWPMLADTATRILVADDDPILREFAIVHLSAPQTEVEVAEDGVSALDRLKLGGIDIALVDLDMPLMNGFELIQAIRSDCDLANLPIVVVTGREDMQAVDRAFQVGATGFAVKPLNWRLLAHQLAYVLRNSRAEGDVRIAKKIAEEGARLKTNLLRLLRHELYTPMNAILGFGELIFSHAQDDATRNHARHILTAAHQLKKANDTISEAASALAGELAPKMRNFAIADLLKAGARQALARGGNPADLKLIDRTASGEFDADWDMMAAALAHLIQNGLTHGAAPVVISAQRGAANSLILRVEDHGRGIAPDRSDNLYKPFQSSDNILSHGAGSGLGLGLAIVAAYVRAHGGALHQSNLPHGGFGVQIELPDCHAPGNQQRAA